MITKHKMCTHRACFCKFQRLWKALPFSLNERSRSQRTQMPQIIDFCSARSLHIFLWPWWPGSFSTYCVLCLQKEKAENTRTVLSSPLWPQVLGKTPQCMAGPSRHRGKLQAMSKTALVPVLTDHSFKHKEHKKGNIPCGKCYESDGMMCLRNET